MHGGGGEIRGEGHLHTGGAGESRREYVSDRLDGARDHLRTAIARAGDSFSGVDGFAGALKQNALASVGLAFSAGFFVALTTGGMPRPGGFLDNRRRQLKAVLLSALTAAVAQEVRTVLQEEDVAALLRSWRDAGREKLDQYDL